MSTYVLYIGILYLLQVQTINDFGASEWSDVFSFNTIQGKQRKEIKFTYYFLDVQ